MVSVPAETPDDLAERYRQLRIFDIAETTLVDALVRHPDRLSRQAEQTLRLALSFARLWVVPGHEGQDEIVVGPKLGRLRQKVRVLAETIQERRDDQLASLGNDAEQLAPILKEAKDSLLSDHHGRLLSSAVDAEVCNKSLVLVLGGGGGCGYVHLGAFSFLESLGATPKLVAGSSMGSVLGLFRSRDTHYRDPTVRAVMHGLTFKKLFRVLQGEATYGLPGTLRLYLRSALSRFFVGGHGQTMRFGELDIPFLCVVTGLRREALRRDYTIYEQELAQRLRRGAFGALLHIKDLVQSWTKLMSDMITSGGMKSIALGGDAVTKDFDVLDAVGFSCSVPTLIHYDIDRDDPRMHELMQQTLAHHSVDHFVDGGVSSNVPTRAAWETVQRGRIGTRNTLILGLDCFKPQLRRNMLFLPLMRLAADNVARDREFAHRMFSYKKVLSPAAFVPGRRSLQTAIKNGRTEFETEGPFIQKMLETLPAI